MSSFWYNGTEEITKQQGEISEVQSRAVQIFKVITDLCTSLKRKRDQPPKTPTC